ncbi:hypothetical protein F5Y03DRAFT_388580 [Xylaria venustula]|nr:hypothetical protein F5Y03DRAFT_388580 [Xylaria venustula]
MALPQRGTLREMLFGGTASQLVPLLAVPVRPQRPPPTLQAQQGRQGNNALSFSNLPTEIHCLVLDYIECIEDVICLGLANEYFWTLAQPHLDDYYMSFLGTWSGKNIVCVGDEVGPDDYPAHLFSAEELDTLRPLRNNVLRGDPKWPYVQCNTPFALSHFADPSVSDVQDLIDPRTEAWRLLWHCKSLGKGKDPAFAARGHRIIPEASTYFPENQPWILRNLTTKEFVRPGPIAIKPEYIHGTHILVVSFGKVVMLRTCWSSAPSNAGHRFDITTLARHEGNVAKEISEAWHYEFGADIREHLMFWYAKRPNKGFFDDTPP